MTASRYSVGGSENEYMDLGQTILKNKKDIADLRALFIEEEKTLARAYELLLDEMRSDTPISSDLIKHIHGRIFSDLYEWAGRWRTASISKEGTTWPPPDYLGEAMIAFERDVLAKFPATSLMSDDLFCKAIGHIQGEFVTDVLAVQTGRLALVYDPSDIGRDRYIEAARSALLQNYEPMIAVITSALSASKRSP